ncbi:hypothetical protein [Aquipseudomonas guryensis]|uniref:Uncharacterized protein n=1 Tax=Aquipseudomonas guryensis TaxID=2759165 RepID=A0A7W4DBZ9_9GAMM|nr:hypothetical protein [Pseudomonas guryensis]MBB1519839.1 hypothetical protein [Pseudomonas guryensis]
MTERKRINQVAELNNQLERGTLFAHTALGENALRLNQLQAVVHGLADLLIAKGVVDSSELGQAMQRVDEELRQRGEQLGPGTLIRVETIEDQPPTATVDCESRLHICKAVCCRLNFALSVAEIEDGHARWDLGQPYHIRKQPDGCCVHQTTTTAPASAGATAAPRTSESGVTSRAACSITSGLPRTSVKPRDHTQQPYSCTGWIRKESRHESVAY